MCQKYYCIERSVYRIHKVPPKAWTDFKSSYYGEASGWNALSDDGVCLTRLDQLAGQLRCRLDYWTLEAGPASEVPEGDVDSLSSTCLDDPRALGGASLGGLSDLAADVAVPGCDDEGSWWYTGSSVANDHCTSNSDKICFVFAELHEDDDKKFKIETESRISIWRSLVF